MQVVVSKIVTANKPEEILSFVSQGYRVTAVTASQKDMGGNGVRATGRRCRRRRPPTKTTPEMRQQIVALRKEGKLWRVIGKRFGVSASRAWQIATGK